MKLLARTVVLLAVPVLGVPVLAAPAVAEPPRPGCGFGDTNHAHQAAPGLDPVNLRPGKGTGDGNHPHTLPPGQAPAGGGDQPGPMRGCPDDPRG